MTDEDLDIQLPLIAHGVYDFRVKWGDGAEDVIASAAAEEKNVRLERTDHFAQWDVSGITDMSLLK